MEHFFNELFDYNLYGNQKLISQLVAHADKVSQKSLQLMSHIINAHQIWNSRILKTNSFKVFDLHGLEQLADLDKENHQTSKALLKTINLSDPISYVNSQGQAFENSIQDILYHIINHSNYHRGQINSDGKANGIAPVVTDYIFYKR